MVENFYRLNENTTWESLESLSENSQHWNCLDPRDRKSHTTKRGGIYEVSDDTDVKLALASLSRKVDALALSQSMNPSPNARIEVMCLMCKFISQCTILSIYTSLSRSILRACQCSSFLWEVIRRPICSHI